MRISPNINTSAYKYNFPTYARQTIKQAKATTMPSLSFGAKNNESQLPQIVYYYHNIEFPNEQRIYSSTNQQLLERPANFLINRFQDVPCPACGKTMLTREEYDSFLVKLDKADSDEYLNILEDYTKYMPPVEASVFKDLKDLSEKSGEKDIRKLIVTLRTTKIPQLQEIQMRKLKKMRSLAKQLPPKEKTELLSKLDKLQGYIKNTKSEAPFRRKIMIDGISKFPIANRNKYLKLQRIANSFPTSTDINSAWIVKYSGNDKHGEPWDSRRIAERLLEFSVPNTDHIIARDIEENRDDINNYMAIHQGCNGKKGNKSVMKWYSEDRDLRHQSLTAYFKKVNELISSGAIKDSRYENYVANATDELKEVSKEQINIEI